jgi:hypothetical protein
LIDGWELDCRLVGKAGVRSRVRGSRSPDRREPAAARLLP